MRNSFKSNLRALPWAMALLLSAVAAGCGGGGGGSGAGTVAAGAGSGAGGLGNGPAPVNLLSIATNNFVILSQSGTKSTGAPPSSITGNIGSSPITAAATTVACAEMQAGGIIYGVDTTHADAACSSGDAAAKLKVDNAVADMGTAYTDANSRAPDYTELGAGNIGGMTLAPATYKWGTDLLIPTDVTLSGGPNDVWIFQIAQGLSVASGAQIILAGGAQAKNIYWATFAAADIGTTAKFNGILLSQTSIAMKTGSSIHGRLLAQTAVTLDGATIAP